MDSTRGSRRAAPGRALLSAVAACGAALIAARTSYAATREVPVPNAGFESEVASRLFTPNEAVAANWDTWEQGGALLAVDRAVARSGKAAARISNAPDNAGWMQMIPIKPGMVYVVEGYMRTRDAESATLAIRWKDRNSRWINAPRSAARRCRARTTGRGLSARDEAPPEAGYIAIMLALRGARRAPRGSTTSPARR